nr:n-terminal acetyltransferase a complex subunit nat1 [Quercus suber]
MSTQAPLPSKEATLFRHLVQFYETKQYKKGLKNADQILRKHPNHGDTQCMKALIMSGQGKQEEAFELCKVGLKNAMKSHVCWHVYGLLWRSKKDYEEAIKAYRFALRLDPDSTQIQRDLALLQVQMRDYAGYVQSRRQMLQARPQTRQNWTALAVGLHLSDDLVGAEDVLTKYEQTLKETPRKTDTEHGEAIMYKNTIIAESGDLARALEHLDSISKLVLDRTAFTETRADYLLRLGRKEEAEKTYKILLQRNPEKRLYYEGLEAALGLDRTKLEDHVKLGEMYQNYAEKSERTDAARRIPLDFMEGGNFRSHADKYLRRMFKKGVPSTFANLKQLYANPGKKETICQLAEALSNENPPVNGMIERGQANGSADVIHKADGDKAAVNWQLSVNYFLAQHYSYHLSRDLDKAQNFIDKAIAINPSKTDYTYHMTRARILKHRGDTTGASKAMNEAREMDLRDRYINTKCAKYQLRNDQHDAAVDTMGLFTRKEAVGGPLGDLLDMQCVWYITEDGESYLRQGKYSLALKRFKAVYDIFEIWQEDQFDFHSFSLRKGMIRAYVDMVRWEDRLREHPFYTRAALSAIKVYLLLNDDPMLGKNSHLNGSSGDGAERRKAAKKAAKAAEKAEAEKKAAAAKRPQPKADDGETKVEDPDPNGLELIRTEKPLEEAVKYLMPLLELSPKNIDAQVAGFEVYTRRPQSIDPDHPKCHELSTRLKHILSNLSEPLSAPVQQVMNEQFLSKQSSKSLEEINEEYLTLHQASALQIHSVARLRSVLEPASEKATSQSAQNLLDTLSLVSLTLKEAEEGLAVLKAIGADSAAQESYIKAANTRFPQADVFSLKSNT